MGPTPFNSITYLEDMSNAADVAAFVDPQPVCPTCKGYGEFETEYGPRGCSLCCSRLIPIFERTASGKPEYVDWGETIVREADGRFSVLRPEVRQ